MVEEGKAKEKNRKRKTIEAYEMRGGLGLERERWDWQRRRWDLDRFACVLLFPMAMPCVPFRARQRTKR